jgi:hypothetical protein
MCAILAWLRGMSFVHGEEAILEQTMTDRDMIAFGMERLFADDPNEFMRMERVT